MDKLAGKVAIVTGGGRGLGRATALAFAEAGAAVMVVARSIQEIDETVALIKAAGGRAAACQADVTNLADLRKMLEVTEAELGPPTVLMNNAGASLPTTAHGDLAAWQRLFAINFWGVMHGVQAFTQPMIDRL